MLCDKCKVDKLSNEFPPDNVSEDCDHPSLICMRCILKYVKENKQCPVSGCGIAVDPKCQTIKILEASLAEMFTEYEMSYTPQVVTSDGTSFLQITVLNGESKRIPYSPTMTILQVKETIKREWNHDVFKQKLLYNNTELKPYTNGIAKQLSDYNVKPNSTVFLVVLLYSIPEAFDHVVFDLCWDFPSTGVDFLDASCLVYQGTSSLGVCDYLGCHSLKKNISLSGLSGLRHSGDKLDKKMGRGHHTIDVNLKQLPLNATHLYFTLSAWNSPNISRYPNPSLKFYEASNPIKDLCKTTFSHAGYSQAVVMCSVSRGSEGNWQIYESGKQSEGNAINYAYLDNTIKLLIKSGF